MFLLSVAVWFGFKQHNYSVWRDGSSGLESNTGWEPRGLKKTGTRKQKRFDITPDQGWQAAW